MSGDRPSSSASEGHVEPRPQPAFPRRSHLASVALVLALLPVVAWASCATEVLDPNDGGGIAWLVSVPLALLGAVLGFANAWRIAKRPLEARPLGKKLSLAAGVVGLLSPILSFLAGLPLVEITRGRRLVRDGRSRLPETGADTGWLEGAAPRSLPAPPEAARAWRENAATEAASIASFAHLSTQLLALGAPAELVEAAHEDALDEIRHAKLCYGLARAIDGAEIGPAPFPWAVKPADDAVDFARLAADAVVEACLLEGASARLVAALASRADTHPQVRAVLKEIAADEGRHAAHGWDLIRWAREQGGPAVDEAVVRALEKTPPTIRAGLDAAWADGQLARWGIPSDALWEQAYAAAYAHTARRLHDLVAPRRAA